MITPSRRRFLFGAATTVLAAPVIIRVAQLMPISAPKAITGGFTNAEIEAISNTFLRRYEEAMSDALAHLDFQGHRLAVLRPSDVCRTIRPEHGVVSRSVS